MGSLQPGNVNLPPLLTKQMGVVICMQSWKEKIEAGSLHKQTEVVIHVPFTQNIMAEVLGYTPFGAESSWTISREYAVIF